MTKRNPIAGGFLLIVPIIAGFAIGLLDGQALSGALIGLVVGIALAVVIWLIDRSRT